MLYKDMKNITDFSTFEAVNAQAQTPAATENVTLKNEQDNQAKIQQAIAKLHDQQGLIDKSNKSDTDKMSAKGKLLVQVAQLTLKLAQSMNREGQLTMQQAKLTGKK